ncbi:MAG TPA: amidohydrolase family protein, partial [Blastocatellia bacterium]|nr:amidohydrolase family protein [Blastocatellia bacterium]
MMRSLVRALSPFIICGLLLSGCRSAASNESADLLLTGGKVYTFNWDDPATDGAPAKNAPYSSGVWKPDAEAVAVRGARIIFVGSSREAEKYRGAQTRVINLQGATVIPGLVDSHTHIAGLGEKQSRVDLIGVQTEEEAVARVVAFAAKVPKGEWVLGRGWDEGAWANRYPTMKLLSERVPDHPVLLAGLHSFAAWGNKLAFERAKITR